MRKLKRSEIPKARQLLLAHQNNRCALCDCDFAQYTIKNRKRVPKYKPALDHCHNHGAVRAVLCTNCNGREGEIWNRAARCKRDKDEIWWLERLLNYWKKHQTPQTQFIHPDHKSEDEKRLERNKKERQRRARQKAAAVVKEQS